MPPGCGCGIERGCEPFGFDQILDGFEDVANRLCALAGLARHLPEVEKTRIQKEALKTALEITNERLRTKVLAGLSVYLPVFLDLPFKPVVFTA